MLTVSDCSDEIEEIFMFAEFLSEQQTSISKKLQSHLRRVLPSIAFLFFLSCALRPPLPHHHNFAPLDPPFFAGGGIIIKRNRKEIFSNISRGLIFTKVLIPRISLYLEYLSMLLRPPFFYATINHIFCLGTAAAESEHNYRKKNHNI